jgi:hypothetical protein
MLTFTFMVLHMILISHFSFPLAFFFHPSIPSTWGWHCSNANANANAWYAAYPYPSTRPITGTALAGV